MSEGSFESEVFTSNPETTLDGVLYLVIGSLGVVGHLATLLTFMKGNILHSPKHVLHLHFNLANIGVIILFALPGMSLINGRWMFGDDACNLYGFVTFFSGLSAIGFIAALALERYLVNCWTDLYCRLSAGHIHLLALLIWAQGLFWAAMPATRSWSRYAYEPGRMTCNLDWTSADDSHASFIRTITVICFIVPFTSVAFCLALANMAVDKKEAEEEKGDCMTERQLLKITGFTVVMALLTWTPCASNCLYSAVVGGDKNPSFIRVAVPALAAKAGTSLVSLIYPSLSPQFRYGLTRMLVGTDKKEL
ncbi:visual pigment-like receptor peropsin [Lineus longissimus]|uniref:visual pigment-like receptor peropsin n=1 Tax=Lineus longissimus TaxID=88925 RepID=UPI002B4EB05E